jgi:hypothetical protein
MTLSIVEVITTGVLAKSYDSNKTLYSIATKGVLPTPPKMP